MKNSSMESFTPKCLKTIIYAKPHPIHLEAAITETI